MARPPGVLITICGRLEQQQLVVRVGSCERPAARENSSPAQASHLHFYRIPLSSYAASRSGVPHTNQRNFGVQYLALRSSSVVVKSRSVGTQDLRTIFYTVFPLAVFMVQMCASMEARLRRLPRSVVDVIPVNNAFTVSGAGFVAGCVVRVGKGLVRTRGRVPRSWHCLQTGTCQS